MNIDKLLQNPENIRVDLKLTDLREFGREIIKEYVESSHLETNLHNQGGQYIKTEKVCEKLNISRTMLWTLDKRGVTKPVRLGNVKRYLLSDIEALGKQDRPM
jgi:predicted DNA-binding transcriptional regulator AlpA